MLSLSNIKTSPRTTIVGLLIGLLGLTSTLGGYAGVPANVRVVCGAVATLAGVVLGLLGVDPSKGGGA